MKVNECVFNFAEKIKKVASGELKVKALKSGIKGIDDHLGTWLRGGRFMLLAARPGVGKSALSLQIVENIAAEHSVIFFSLEMPHEEVVCRSLSMNSETLTLSNLRSFNIDRSNKDELSELKEGMARIKDLNLWIERGQEGFDDIAKRVKEIKKEVEEQGKPPVALVVIDYMNRVVSGKTADELRLKLTKLAKDSRDLAIDEDVAVFGLAQTNRGSIKGKDFGIEVLSDSDGLGVNADFVMFINENKGLQKKAKKEDLATINILKCKDGFAGVSFQLLCSNKGVFK